VTSKEDGRQIPLPHPTRSDPAAWKAYWKAKDQPWRTEPEISPQRQKNLEQRRSIVPDIDKGIYPFGGMKLNRADVEWLLATHEDGQGPVDWSDEHQRHRQGLDLRGADLYQADLQSLPLARTCAGLIYYHGISETMEQLDGAAVHLEQTDLRWAHMEGACLRDAHLEQTSLRWAHLEEADLSWAHIEEADLRSAHMEHVYLFEAHLERADLRGTYLKEAYLLQGHLNNTWLSQIHLEGALLENITLSDEKRIGPRLADVDWSNINLAIVKWSQVDMLGDEYKAQQKKHAGKVKDKATRLNEHEIAVRANRQLAVALQTQGLNEDAARFAYRAQKLQRVVLSRQRKFGQYFFSLFLDLLAGYGYRPGRSVFWYLVIIFGFAIAYFALGHLSLLPDSFVFSLTSFHGRGFFPGLGNETSLHNPLVVLAAIEAVIGLFIEISFIATFTKRFFGS
jgi:uncharacterized protein YjbI with pentapeptide repeats